MSKLVCPHAAKFVTVMMPPPVDPDGDEDDDDEYHDSVVNSQENTQLEIAHAHSGRVKALAKMYDSFVENLQLDRDMPAPWKTRLSVSTTGHSVVQDIKDQAGPSSLSASKVAVSEIQETLTEAERLDLLEVKMDAVVTFVRGLLTHELESLGKSYTQDLTNHKESTLVKAKLKAFDDELDEIQINYEDVHMMVQNSKKEIATVKSALVKCTQFATKTLGKEIHSLKLTQRTILKKLNENSEEIKRLKESMKVLSDTLPGSLHENGKTKMEA